MADLFISSRSADLPAARLIRRELDLAGYSCWLYADDPMPTETWATSVIAEIRACRGMVVVLSRDALASDRISRELSLGSELGKPALAVRIEDVSVYGSLAYLLMMSPRVDAFPASLRAYGEAIRSAAATLLARKAPDTTAPPAPGVGLPPALRGGLVVFISYRRQDTGGWALPLYEALVDRFGHEAVFMDVDTIEPGEDWRDRIDRAIEASDVVLVLIGPWWASITDASGARRLDAQDDRLRAEIVASIKTSAKRVIPVLVGGASMPRASEIPEELRGLVSRQAVALSPTRYRADLHGLLTTLAALDARKQSTP